MAPTEHWLPAYIGIGSNLDDPVARVEAAIEALGREARIHTLMRSSLWRTAPLGTGPQPDYINAVAGCLWRGSPSDLLDFLLATERAHGRRRDGVRWAARRLDLDLLLVSDRTLDTATLTLPHPRLGERAFVIEPLSEVAPTLVVPGLGSLRDLRASVRGQRLERLADGA